MFKPSEWSARNPLGIIALFIALIYGMGVGLLGATVDAISQTNQTILVVFLVAFPFVVLLAFYKLVAKHHHKLYSPSDYRSDASFIEASFLPPASLGTKLREEVALATGAQFGLEPAQEEVPVDLGPPLQPGQAETIEVVPVEVAAPSNLSETSQYRQVTNAYVAESLVFQELQNEFGGSVVREVGFDIGRNRHMEFDGIVRAEQKQYFVEVKFFQSAVNPSRFTRLIEKVRRQASVVKDQGFPGSELVVALVLPGKEIDAPSTAVAISDLRSALGGLANLRVYSYEALLDKYGFPSSGLTQ